MLAFETVTDSTLIATVNDIIAAVREDGDDAVLKLTQEFDKHPAKSMHELFVSADQLKAAFDGLADDVKHALQYAAKRILSFISIKSRRVFALPIIWAIVWDKSHTLDRVGIYVPGIGKLSV